MASLIDYEAEATDVIFVGRDEVATPLEGGSIAAERGDAFGHAGVPVAPDRRNHDPVGCVITFKGATILLVGLSGLEALSVDRFQASGYQSRIVLSAQRLS